jgi:hypothetical protein
LRPLLASALRHPLANQAPFELGEDASHLPDGRTHRIIGVVFEDLASIAKTAESEASSSRRSTGLLGR